MMRCLALLINGCTNLDPLPHKDDMKRIVTVSNPEFSTGILSKATLWSWRALLGDPAAKLTRLMSLLV
jgi:hypothetical protein